MVRVLALLTKNMRDKKPRKLGRRGSAVLDRAYDEGSSNNLNDPPFKASFKPPVYWVQQWNTSQVWRASQEPNLARDDRWQIPSYVQTANYLTLDTMKATTICQEL